MSKISCSTAPAGALGRCRLSAAAVANSSGIGFADLYLPNRCRRPIALARQKAIYLAHVGFGLSYDLAAKGFGRDRTTVRHACAVIENTRDDRNRDLALAWLEAALRRYGAFCDSLSATDFPNRLI